ncbi:MAG TPA: phosphate ABC transporter substrate-binding protein PstS [Gemmatimonadaceae bacterium]|nr:phosphate ABC transporter substrate-binding protein PstS [Gemmatimonadaceae bacterium]
MTRNLAYAAATLLVAATLPAAARAQDLTGAGSSFAYPIYTKWADMYAQKTGVKINYQSIGSSGGIKQLSEEIVDFGASDGPMTDEQIAQAKGGPILHFPTVLGGVSITYNLPEVKQPLRLTGAALADIYLGKITKWNAPEIAALNAGVRLPDRDVVVVHRTDGSGTTYIFTDYLSSVSSAWASGPGKAQAINWPVGLGGKGSDGVTGQVKQTPGAIGYVELSYAKHNALPSALIRNAAGAWVAPTLESVTAAAAGAVAKLPASSDYRISIVNPAGRDAYPISSFTWMLVYQHQKDAAKGKKLVDFLRWAYVDGEKVARSLDYAPLPASMARKLVARLSQISTGVAEAGGR